MLFYGKNILKRNKLENIKMKKYFLLFVIILLSGCNSFRCEFTHPDNMSPALLDYCKAEASSADVYVAR